MNLIMSIIIHLHSRCDHSYNPDLAASYRTPVKFFLLSKEFGLCQVYNLFRMIVVIDSFLLTII